MRLFAESEGRESLPIRPLSELSDFVVEGLANNLTGVREGCLEVRLLSEIIEELIGAMEFDFASMSEKDLLVSRLDILTLEMAIVHSGGKIGDNLRGLSDQISLLTDRPACITYEDLVLINPRDDRRLYTEGGVGESEDSFYEAHRLIEEKLDKVLSGMFSIARELAETGVDLTGELAARMTSLTADLESSYLELEKITMDLPKDDFAAFRRYYGPHPTRNLKGPSGQFSAALPVMDILLAGDRLPVGVVDYWLENEIYFPYGGRQMMREAWNLVNDVGSIRKMTSKLGDPDELIQVIGEFDKALKVFRAKHYRGVSHQIPEALSGATTGTSGESDVAGFLKERINISHV